MVILEIAASTLVLLASLCCLLVFSVDYYKSTGKNGSLL
jgi:hypothetical protein